MVIEGCLMRHGEGGTLWSLNYWKQNTPPRRGIERVERYQFSSPFQPVSQVIALPQIRITLAVSTGVLGKYPRETYIASRMFSRYSLGSSFLSACSITRAMPPSRAFLTRATS